MRRSRVFARVIARHLDGGILGSREAAAASACESACLAGRRRSNDRDGDPTGLGLFEAAHGQVAEHQAVSVRGVWVASGPSTSSHWKATPGIPSC